MAYPEPMGGGVEEGTEGGVTQPVSLINRPVSLAHLKVPPHGIPEYLQVWLQGPLTCQTWSRHEPKNQKDGPFFAIWRPV